MKRPNASKRPSCKLRHRQASNASRPARTGKVTISLKENTGILATGLRRRRGCPISSSFLRSGKAIRRAWRSLRTGAGGNRPPGPARDECSPYEFCPANRTRLGREDRRASAVAAAIPYLKKADHVEILSIQRPPLQAEATEGVREFLMLHGIACEERLIDPGSKRIGEALLEAAAAAQTDLLVLCGYGSGRLRESLIGGVSRHVIAHAGIAVFMVH